MEYSNDNVKNNNSDDFEEINENSVEYKLVSQYNKNNNILNKIYYEKNPDYKTLMEFIKKYELSKDSNIKSNITCPGGRYLIPTDSAVRFFELLKSCAMKNLVLHFRELQTNDFSKREGSGIMFDFDLLQKSEKNEIQLKNFTPFLRRMFTILNNLIKINETDEIHFGIIIKKTLVYKEEKKMYKNGFHILIPSIQLARSAKRLIYNEMLNDERLQGLFKETFNNNLKDVFDMGSYSVPVYFIYNCKEDSTEPYEFYNMYKVNYCDGMQIDVLNRENILATYNIISELSLNFKSDLIQKKYYDLKDIYNARILNTEAQANRFEEEKEQTMHTFNTLESYVDENLTYYKKIVMEILDVKRAEDRNLWRDVIFAIANISTGSASIFKPIAKLFSMRNEQKWDTNEFEKIWNEATSNTSENKLSVKSLIYWAIIDNKEKFKKILDKDILSTIELDVYNSNNRVLNGTLYQYQFGYYIYHLFKQKFIFDIDGTDKGKWYEFVLEKDPHNKGEIFKWRYENRPDNLILYMSNKLPQIISKVILKAEDRVKNNPDDKDINEYVLARTKNLKKSAQNLYQTQFKNGVIREAENFFRQRGFIEKLNSDQNIMGVGNGVLELSESPKLITYYHDYPISSFTEVEYEPYNSNNPHTLKLLKVLLDLFPKAEMDAFHYIMYYLATCLDGKPKDSIILILTGHGCHGIDTPIMLYDGNIKKVQNIKIGDKLMGDDNTPRIVKQLFQGKDKMVRITPTKENSFIVNINHILSLKFTNVISVSKRSDGYYKDNTHYRVIWYEYNGYHEPKRHSKTVKSYDLALEFKEEIIKLNENIIKKGDIIDIKIKDLLKWNKWWLNKGNLTLYKSKCINFSEKRVNIDPYLLGYWLGDGHSSEPLFTTMENEVVKEFENKLPTFEIKKQKQEKGLAYTYRIKDNTKHNSNRFLEFLKNYNLIENKHIPFDYKTSSINQRLEILAGIIDSDGHYQKKMNQYELTLKSEKLIDGCIELVRSLGLSCFKKKINKTCTNGKNGPVTGKYFRIQIYGEGIEKIPSRLSRKQASIKQKDKNSLMDSFKIELLEEDTYYGFELDGNHRYLTGDHIIHHNSNGKSFFAELIKSVMGKYGAKMAMSFLTEARGKSAGADEQLMVLKGARLAYYSETDKNEALNTAKLKELTSQESMTGRGIFEKQQTFRPTCSHMVTTNYQFSIKTTDHGIWRRIVTYSFKMKFDDNPDPENEYEKKIDPSIAKEFSFNPEIKKSFLSILVEYYKDLQINHNGMLKNIMKPSIDKETTEYRNKEDIINRFIDEYCIYSPNSKLCLSELIDKYEMWYENNVGKNHVPEKMEIRNQLQNSKIVKYIKKGTTKVMLQDIRIKDDLVENDDLLENEYFLRDILLSKKNEENKYDINKFNPLHL